MIASIMASTLTRKVCALQIAFFRLDRMKQSGVVKIAILGILCPPLAVIPCLLPFNYKVRRLLIR